MSEPRRSGRGAWIAIGIGALAMLGALASGARSAILHEAARAAWVEEAARVGAPGYDRSRSDALYDEALALRDDAARAGWIAALFALVAAAGLGTGARASVAGLAPLRGWSALAIDAVLVVIALVAIAALTDALGAGHAALASVASPVGGACVIGAEWIGTARGATPGALISGVRFAIGSESPGPVRAAAILALAPLSLLSAPVLLSIALVRRRAASPPHLAWAGIEARCRARS